MNPMVIVSISLLSGSGFLSLWIIILAIKKKIITRPNFLRNKNEEDIESKKEIEELENVSNITKDSTKDDTEDVDSSNESETKEEPVEKTILSSVHLTIVGQQTDVKKEKDTITEYQKRANQKAVDERISYQEIVLRIKRPPEESDHTVAFPKNVLVLDQSTETTNTNIGELTEEESEKYETDFDSDTDENLSKTTEASTCVHVSQCLCKSGSSLASSTVKSSRNMNDIAHPPTLVEIEKQARQELESDKFLHQVNQKNEESPRIQQFPIDEYKNMYPLLKKEVMSIKEEVKMEDGEQKVYPQLTMQEASSNMEEEDIYENDDEYITTCVQDCKDKDHPHENKEKHMHIKERMKPPDEDSKIKAAEKQENIDLLECRLCVKKFKKIYDLRLHTYEKHSQCYCTREIVKQQRELNFNSLQPRSPDVEKSQNENRSLQCVSLTTRNSFVLLCPERNCSRQSKVFKAKNYLMKHLEANHQQDYCFCLAEEKVNQITSLFD